MLMSIEIDKSRYKSITSPENFVIIDFYRQIKLINRQLSTIIEHYRLIDWLFDDRFRSTCYVLIKGTVFKNPKSTGNRKSSNLSVFSIMSAKISGRTLLILFSIYFSFSEGKIELIAITRPKERVILCA